MRRQNPSGAAAARVRMSATPATGRFYYRCSKRCKRYPTIQENTLNDAVREAVREAILNPTLITDQFIRNREAEEASNHRKTGEVRRLAEEAKRLESEEARVLEAYRLGITTAAQLGRELEQLNTRSSAIQIRQEALSSQAEQPPTEEMTAAALDFCAWAAERIGTFSFDERRQFLRTVVKRVVFAGSQARIEGQISVKPETAPVQGDRVAEATPAYGRIATTEIGSCGRNPAVRFLLTGHTRQ